MASEGSFTQFTCDGEQRLAEFTAITAWRAVAVLRAKKSTSRRGFCMCGSHCYYPSLCADIFTLITRILLVLHTGYAQYRPIYKARQAVKCSRHTVSSAEAWSASRTKISRDGPIFLVICVPWTKIPTVILVWPDQNHPDRNRWDKLREEIPIDIGLGDILKDDNENLDDDINELDFFPEEDKDEQLAIYNYCTYLRSLITYRSAHALSTTPIYIATRFYRVRTHPRCGSRGVLGVHGSPPRSSKIGYKYPKGGRLHLLTSTTAAGPGGPPTGSITLTGW